MLISSSVRMWLGSSTLAGLLLVSSLPALALTQPATILTPMKPTLLASTVEPTGTYAKAVRKQLQWTGSPVMTNVRTVTAGMSVSVKPVEVAAQPTKTVQTTKTTKNDSRPVQVAAVAKKQVSRSDGTGLVNNALSLQGVPYVFGGTSRSGFDCSGYTQYVFNGSGTSLPRTAGEQFNVGSSVNRNELQAGDLVFFTTYAPGASHVGIYIGGGRFVHASNSGVRTTSLGDSYYAGRYLGARRVAQ
ncbi:C40 family peptidase [Desulfosporosinus sp. Sb-LF]|uniref:C40 family peptidase n=1 Tax=Desulfosporosinus sp. Sb-LF TaxID=2560027 RepID=UPI001FB08E26|nr:C40 family peptidase [Desulfosporosinus sp. Sb-LF]